MSGNVRITPPEGWNVSITSKDVTVAPMDYAELDITLTGSNSAVKPIIFSAEFDGERVSDAVSYINSKNLGPYDAHRYISNIELNSISYTDDMLKTEFKGGQCRLNESDLVLACPFAIFRGYGIGHRTVCEVLQ